jgi:hypothetical protein
LTLSASCTPEGKWEVSAKTAETSGTGRREGAMREKLNSARTLGSH